MTPRAMLFHVSVVAGIFMLLCSHISAYETCKTESGKDIKWNNPDATYFINDSGGPFGTIAAVRAGMQTWTDVATSEFVFDYGGTTSNSAYGENDGANIVTFGTLPVGTVAENRFWYTTFPPTREGELLDSDVQFNTYYSWGTTGSSGVYDVQNVGTHEHGHSLCLVDLYTGADSDKTMYGYVSSGETKKQTLDQDDIDGIAYLYACPHLPVRIWGTPLEYSFLQDAYDDAQDDDIIQSQATIFIEDLFIDDVNNKTVSLEGGYNCDYSAITGITELQGNVTITKGSLFIEDVALW